MGWLSPLEAANRYRRVHAPSYVRRRRPRRLCRIVAFRNIFRRRRRGRTVVIGAGKAAGAMAAAVEDHWPGAYRGLVVTRYGHAAPCRANRGHRSRASGARTQPGARPRGASLAHGARLGAGRSRALPDFRRRLGAAGAAGARPHARGQTGDQPRPAASGATISEMNCVRKHLSAIKGGRLACRCAPARVVTLMISDVPGDDPR